MSYLEQLKRRPSPGIDTVLDAMDKALGIAQARGLQQQALPQTFTAPNVSVDLSRVVEKTEQAAKTSQSAIRRTLRKVF